MPENEWESKIPADLKAYIGKTIQRKLPDGRIIKFVVGDITGDGKIDEDDINILRLLCQGGPTAEALFSKLTTEQMSACDVTGDGFVNREDLLALCKTLINCPSQKTAQDKLSSLRNKIKK